MAPLSPAIIREDSRGSQKSPSHMIHTSRLPRISDGCFLKIFSMCGNSESTAGLSLPVNVYNGLSVQQPLQINHVDHLFG